MAFSTQRGRPRKPLNDNDPGTPELRLKHALRMTIEPIDLCLEKSLITDCQHWCGLHLRWLYTLRYGAPSVTSSYTDRQGSGGTGAETQEESAWKIDRITEYTDAIALLHAHRRYDCVMRLAVYNETPSFLSTRLRAKATEEYATARALAHAHEQLQQGLELLAHHWRRTPRNRD